MVLLDFYLSVDGTCYRLPIFVLAINSVSENPSYFHFYHLLLLILDFHGEALKRQHVLGITPSPVFLPPVIRLKCVTTHFK